MKRLFTIIVGSFVAVFCLLSSTHAQEIKIKMIKTENGEKRTFERTYQNEQEMKEDKDYQEFVGQDDHVNVYHFSSDSRSVREEDRRNRATIRVIESKPGHSYSYSFGDQDHDMEVFTSEDVNLTEHLKSITEKLREDLDSEDFERIEAIIEKELDGKGSFYVVSSGNIKVTRLDGDEFGEKGVVKPEEELALDGLRFSPNPSDGRFQLKFQVPEQNNLVVAIYNLEGKRVFESKFDRFNGIFNESIDVSDEPKGIYLLEISMGSKRLTRKIVIN